MGLFAWLERKAFLGEVVKDYGVIDERMSSYSRLRTSVLLCRKSGRLKLVFRVSGVAPFGASVHYATMDATAPTLANLAAIIADVQSVVSAIESRR